MKGRLAITCLFLSPLLIFVCAFLFSRLDSELDSFLTQLRSFCSSLCMHVKTDSDHVAQSLIALLAGIC